MKLQNFLWFVLLAMPLQMLAQSISGIKQQEIEHSLSQYFNLSRENIHIHLNKTIFTSDEAIWFKGYLKNKGKTAQPTTNVHVNLLNEEGKIILTQLHHAQNDVFEGRIALNNQLRSGRYFIQVYTNFMNNFTEDESSVYEIRIINAAEKTFAIPKANTETVTASFFPESGVFLEGVTNTLTIRLADCNGLGVEIKDIQIIDAKRQTVANVATNAWGYGKFEIYQTKREQYAAVFSVNGKRIESPLPMPVAYGVTFSADNYTNPEKIALKIRTNPTTLNHLTGKTYTLAIQQNQSVVFTAFQFKETAEVNLLVPSADLPAGINVIHLLDSGLQKIGERIIYKPLPAIGKTKFEIKNMANDSIAVTGISDLKSATLSVSILPAETVGDRSRQTILGSLVFDNYLSEPITNAPYYLDDFSKKKHLELDTFLLTQKSKYQWDSMLGKAPDAKFTSEKGLTVKGVVEAKIPSALENKINMFAFEIPINSVASINATNEFKFENVFVQDSTDLHFNLVTQMANVPYTIKAQLLPGFRPFAKPFLRRKSVCHSDSSTIIEMPKIENAILLDNVAVSAKNPKLRHQKQSVNAIAKGIKISEKEAGKYRDVLHFLSVNGFTVSATGGKVAIINPHAYQENRNKGVTNKNKKNSNPWSSNLYSDTNNNKNGPTVFIDDLYVENYDLLSNYSMSNIDEIYLNRSVKDVSNFGSSGTIRIYTKPDNQVASMKDSPKMMIKNGFQRHAAFVNPKYDNWGEGFLKIGTVFWDPMVTTDENGNFNLSISKSRQKSVRIIVEGMDVDGNVISESHVLNLE